MNLPQQIGLFLVNYNKTVEQRTTNCDPVITTTGVGTATTTTSTNDTYSGLVTSWGVYKIL